MTITHPSLYTMKAGSTHEKPVAVYRTTVSILLYEVLYVAFAAFWGYIAFKIDVLWAQILCGFIVVMTLWGCVHLLKYRNDRIIVTPSHLSLPNVEKKTKQAQYSVSAKAVLPWSDIKDITSNINLHASNRVSVHMQVTVIMRGGTTYNIDSDMYDTFFLGHKLKAFWQRYDKKH